MESLYVVAYADATLLSTMDYTMLSLRFPAFALAIFLGISTASYAAEVIATSDNLKNQPDTSSPQTQKSSTQRHGMEPNTSGSNASTSNMAISVGSTMTGGNSVGALANTASRSGTSGSNNGLIDDSGNGAVSGDGTLGFNHK